MNLKETFSPENKTPGQKDKAATVLAAVSVTVAIFTFFLAAGILYNTWVKNKSDELAGCRSAFNAEYISGPQARALKALADYGVDSREFEDATNRINPDRFEDLVKLSRTDEGEFLRICRKDD